jgi:putative hydrolase of the HAD superfamily
MILIFDLDDTLYDESSFVDSGFTVVANYGEERWGWDASASRKTLNRILTQQGRGTVFDRWLDEQGSWSNTRVAECVKVYRHHQPNIALFPSARRALRHFGARCPLYIVTDGHKIVQRNKVDALNLWPEFRRIFITHRFGRAAAKPSTLCFQRIVDAEDCDWSDIVYVGDNPNKDFVSLNPLGALTVRVLTGAHARFQAKSGYDAISTIPDLNALPYALKNRFPIDAAEF